MDAKDIQLILLKDKFENRTPIQSDDNIGYNADKFHPLLKVVRPWHVRLIKALIKIWKSRRI